MAATVDVEIDIVRLTTDKAILIVRSSDGKQFWIPRSVIDEECDISEVGDSGTLRLAAWFAEKEGIGDDDEDDL